METGMIYQGSTRYLVCGISSDGRSVLIVAVYRDGTTGSPRWHVPGETDAVTGQTMDVPREAVDMLMKVKLAEARRARMDYHIHAKKND